MINADKIIKGLEESIRKIEAHYDARGVPQEKRSIEGKKALELIKWQRDEIKSLTIEAGALRGAANSYKMHYENLWKENKYLREHMWDEVEHAKDLVIADTVRKMLERIAEAAFYEIFYHEERHLVNMDDIDQIAKEILEGTQND